MDLENEQRPAATGRCNGIALEHLQEQSYQNGPMVEVRVGNLSDALQDEPLFVVDPIIPRDEVTLLSGHGDIGKSYLALAIAVHVACGQDWGPFPVKAGRVLFVTLEDIARRVRYRLARIVSAYQIDAALLDRNLLLLDGACVNASLAEEAAAPRARALSKTTAFQQLAAKSAGYDLIVVDNATEGFTADPNCNLLVRQFVRQMLGQIARTNSLAVLLLAHIDKDAARYGARQQSYLGSVAWHNSARSRIALVEEKGDLVLRHEKHNHSAAHVPVRVARNKFGVPLLDSTAAENSPIFASELAGDVDAILLTIAAATEAGVTVRAAESGAYSAHKVLSEFPQLPLVLRDGPGRRRFWRAVRKCQADHLVHTEEFVTGHRNHRTRFALTPEGVAAAAVLQSPVPPAHHRSSGGGLR